MSTAPDPTTHPTGGAGTGPKREALTSVPKREAYQPREVAFLLGGISYRAVMRLIHDGHISARRDGRSYLVPHAEIERYLAPAVQTTTSARRGSVLRSA